MSAKFHQIPQGWSFSLPACHRFQAYIRRN